MEKQREDTYKELLLQVHASRKEKDRVISEVVLCFENQFGKKTRLSDNNAWILHRIFVEELKKEVRNSSQA